MVDKKKYARSSDRLPVSPQEIKGTLIDDEGGADRVALVWNISVQGLCLWVSHKHAQGEEVTLKVTKPWQGEIACVVRWCRTIPDKSGYLVGLESIDGNKALQELHQRITTSGKKVG